MAISGFAQIAQMKYKQFVALRVYHTGLSQQHVRKQLTVLKSRVRLNHRCLSRCRTKYLISQTRSNPTLVTLPQPVARATPTLPHPPTSVKNLGWGWVRVGLYYVRP